MQGPTAAESVSVWNQLLGLDAAPTAEDWNPIHQRALLVNKLAILLALFANVCTIGSFFVLGDAVPVQALLLMSLSTVLYVSCFLLLHQGKETSSRIVFSVSLLTTVLFLTLSLGTAAMVQILYLPIALGGIIIWPRNALGMMLLGLGSTALFFGLHSYGPAEGVADLQVDEAALGAMATFYAALTVILSGTILLLNSLTSIQLQDLLDAEHKKVENLLLQILPTPVARELLAAGRYAPRRVANVTVLFADIVGFTKMAETHSPETIVTMLNGLFSRFDSLVAEHGVEKIKTVGDAYMVIAGAPRHREDHLEAMARLALDMQRVAKEMTLPDGTPLQLRIGIDTGSAVAGVVGESRSIYDIWGATVNMASRMESHGEPGRIQVTGRVQERLSATHQVRSRGETHVKNIGKVETFWLESGRR